MRTCTYVNEVCHESTVNDNNDDKYNLWELLKILYAKLPFSLLDSGSKSYFVNAYLKAVRIEESVKTDPFIICYGYKMFLILMLLSSLFL